MCLLPITPAESLKPLAAGDPTWGIIMLLLQTVGLPFVIVSASGPLLQHWFSVSSNGASPYRLYAVSNFGSLLGLLSYPFLIEPALGLRAQTLLWSGGFLVYGLLMCVCAWKFVQTKPMSDDSESVVTAESPLMKDRVLWGLLAALGSVLLLATTNQMSQDVTVVPFLWVLPLALYLVTFVISFDHARWYHRGVWIPLALLFVAALVTLLNYDFHRIELHLFIQIGIFVGAMFTCCMICHGEMVRLKPAPAFLTSFYLSVALGGALGGVFVSLIAPQIFDGMWELHLALIAVAVVITCTVGRDVRAGVITKVRLIKFVAVPWGLAVIALGFFLIRHVQLHTSESIDAKRSFYGVLRVQETATGTVDHKRTLYHGRITHSNQFLHTEGHRITPTTYYATTGGAGLVFRYHQKRLRQPQSSLKIGAIGLGAGTLAAYGRVGDMFRFYEINPDVESLAREHFTYLRDSSADITVALGDARIVMAEELATTGSQKFDVLFLDAFSGDSLPMHLFTAEAFSLYLEHLAPDGMIAVHISNRFLDLTDPLRTLAERFGLQSTFIRKVGVGQIEFTSEWVLLSRDSKLFMMIRVYNGERKWDRVEHKPVLWTDDYSNLLEVIKWD